MRGNGNAVGIERFQLVCKGNDRAHFFGKGALFLVGQRKAGKVCNVFNVDQPGVFLFPLDAVQMLLPVLPGAPA